MPRLKKIELKRVSEILPWEVQGKLELNLDKKIGVIDFTHFGQNRNRNLDRLLKGARDLKEQNFKIYLKLEPSLIFDIIGNKNVDYLSFKDLLCEAQGEFSFVAEDLKPYKIDSLFLAQGLSEFKKAKRLKKYQDELNSFKLPQKIRGQKVK